MAHVGEKGEFFSSCWSVGDTCGRRWPCGMPWAPFVTNQEEVNRPGQKVLGTRWCLEEKQLNNLGGLTPALVPFVGLVAPALSTCWPVGLLVTQPSSSSSTSRPWAQGGGAGGWDKPGARCPDGPAAGETSPRASKAGQRRAGTLLPFRIPTSLPRGYRTGRRGRDRAAWM